MRSPHECPLRGLRTGSNPTPPPPLSTVVACQRRAIVPNWVRGRDLSANGALGDGTDDATIHMKPQPEPSSREVLAGLVERVTYHNDGNGYCVLRIKARGHRELVTVVGHAAVISAGEWITASGQWVNDRTHGQQYRAKFLKTSEPTSLDGIEKYLGSRMIREFRLARHRSPSIKQRYSKSAVADYLIGE